MRCFASIFVAFLFFGSLEYTCWGQIVLIPEVATEEGIVKGVTDISRNGREFFTFLNIPYAEPVERFKISQRKRPWTGVLNGQEKGYACAQLLPGEMGAFTGVMGKEDCLHLNVFTPYNNGDELLPVMVFIHGGAFIFLSGDDFRGDYFADEDVVTVTINYRLGALGFLYFEDDAMEGNLGMKDQVLALEWVQRNIHHFGGDPKKVTIFGESAGAASVNYHMLSPRSTGLFRYGISQSGTTLAPWALTTHARESSLRFSKTLGCPVDDTTKTVECLREIDLETMLEEQINQIWGPVIHYKWAPAVEVGKNLNASTAFLTENPLKLLEQGKIANRVPWIVGIMKNEGAMTFSGIILKEEDLTRDINEKWSTVAPKLFYYSRPEDKKLEIERETANMKIRDFYFEGLLVGHDTEQRLTDLFSDNYFVYPTVKTIQAYSHIAPTYTYIYTYSGGFSFLHMVGIENFDPPTHADEVPQLLRFTYRYNVGDHELDFSKAYVKLWASFAKNGAPTATWGPATEWKPVDPKSQDLKWYKIDNKTAVINDPFKRRVALWDQLESNELAQLY